MSDGDEVAYEVRVELKPGVFDAEADSVERSLGQLGIPDVSSVRTARVYRIAFRRTATVEARRRVERAVDQLLANPVIHRVVVSEIPG